MFRDLTLTTCHTLLAVDKSWPTQLMEYNTLMVLFGTTLLGVCGGLVGVFMLLRNRSLVGDVVGHSALPGIAIAFIMSELWEPGSGKNVKVLMLGALTAGLLGAISVMLIDRFSRIKADAALAIVLSLFYGSGTALLTIVQKLPSGSSAGLKDFLFGKTASIIAADVWVFVGATLFLSVITALLFKELCLLCFDEGFAASTGWPVFWLDTLLTGLVVGVTIIGMQSVGLLLVVAILIIPPASARFWSDDIGRMTIISAVLGGVAAMVGTVVSALNAKIAAGAVIVLSGSFFFVISLFLGTRRGVIWKWYHHWKLRRRVGQHDLLRAIYENAEPTDADTDLTDAFLLQLQIEVDSIVKMRSWSRRQVEKLFRRAERHDLVVEAPGKTYRLTPNGAALARRAVRNHRLWEMYLITYADIAPSHVDRDADQIEHVLEADVIRELERRLSEEQTSKMPVSPHDLGQLS